MVFGVTTLQADGLHGALVRSLRDRPLLGHFAAAMTAFFAMTEIGFCERERLPFTHAFHPEVISGKQATGIDQVVENWLGVLADLLPVSRYMNYHAIDMVFDYLPA